MELRQRVNYTLQLEQSQRLTQEQSLRLQQKALELRLGVIEALKGKQFIPKAQCTDCGHNLTPLEILKGFLSDPNDFRTTCPKCKALFLCYLEHRFEGGSMEYAFYCAEQCLGMLRDKEFLYAKTPKEFEKGWGALYNSILVHFGSLRVAYEKIGRNYRQEPNQQILMLQKMRPFFGLVPDKLLVEHSGLSLYFVRKERKKLRIPAYSAQRVLEHFEIY